MPEYLLLQTGSTFPLRLSAQTFDWGGGGEEPSGGDGEYPTDLFIETAHETVPVFARDQDVDVFSAQSGNWTTGSTWVGGVVPPADSIVGIRSGHTVTMNAQHTAEAQGMKAIGIAGILTFPVNANSCLWVEDIDVFDGGELRMGTVSAPVQAGFLAEIVFPPNRNFQAFDPEKWGIGIRVLPGGKFITHGAVKSSYVRMGQHISAGQTSFTLGSAPSGWEVGDTIVFLDTRHINDVNDTNDNRDVRTISSISGTTLTTAATTYAHPGRYDIDGNADRYMHLPNLTRNVRIRSFDNMDTGDRGHIVFLSAPSSANPAWCDMRYTEIRDTGRVTISPFDDTSNHQGRYQGIHLHHVGNGPTGGVANIGGTDYAWVTIGNAVHDSRAPSGSFPQYQRARYGITIHGTNNGYCYRNVIHGVTGAGIWTEIGSESGNRIEENGCCYIQGTNDRGDGRFSSQFQFDAGHEGAGYWFASQGNRFINNWANHCRAYGVAHFAKFQNPYAANVTLEDRGNEFYGNTVTGHTLWNAGVVGSFDYVPGFSECLFQDHVIWNCRKGHYGYQYQQIKFTNWDVRGDPYVLAGGDFQSMAMFYSDYIAAFSTLENCYIINTAIGIYCPIKMGDTRNAGIAPQTTSSTPQTYRVINSTLRCAVNSLHNPPAADTGGGGALNHTRFEFTGCTFGNRYGSTSLDFNFEKPYNFNHINWRIPYEIIVTNANGDPNEDYQVYWNDQDGSFITPHDNSTTGALGSPEAGQTNTQNLAEHGICVFGVITPGGATTSSRIQGGKRVEL